MEPEGWRDQAGSRQNSPARTQIILICKLSFLVEWSKRITVAQHKTQWTHRGGQSGRGRGSREWLRDSVLCRQPPERSSTLLYWLPFGAQQHKEQQQQQQRIMWVYHTHISIWFDSFRMRLANQLKSYFIKRLRGHFPQPPRGKQWPRPLSRQQQINTHPGSALSLSPSLSF